MKLKPVFFSLIILAAAACGSEKPKDVVVESPPEAPQVVTEEMPAALKAAPAGMRIYSNMEIMEYCSLIPEGYEEDQEASDKAGHIFNNPAKKNNTIELKGLLRANSDVSLEDYMKGSVEDAELEGKIIQKKELSAELNCFYIKGYYNNSIHESRFIEVCWLRRDDVVKYSTFFDIADTTVWNERLKKLVAFGSTCQ